MNRRLRTALVVSAALSAGLLMTACGDGSTDAADPETASSSTSAGAAAGATATPTATQSGEAGDQSSSSSSSEGDSGAADKSGYGQSCGTNDLQWSAESKTQAGGYYQVSVKAKSGITCVLPAGLPVFAFGSGGTQAGPAEQVAGEEITLSGSKTVYAGVNPKSSDSDTGVEYSTIIVSVSEGDPNPVSLDIDSAVVDEPLATNWHTDPADAVPFAS